MYRQLAKLSQLQTVDSVKAVGLESVALKSICKTNASHLSLPCCELTLLHTDFTLRTYKSGVNIEWNPPPTLPCYHTEISGDKGTLPEVDKKRLTYQFSRASKGAEVLKNER